MIKYASASNNGNGASGGTNLLTANHNPSNTTIKRLARDYDQFSPIRSIGAQIGTDYHGGVGLGLDIGVPVNFNLHNERTSAITGFLGQDLDIDSTDTLSNSQINHSTLSPQRLDSIREEGPGRARILES